MAHILLIDDDVDFTRFLREALAEHDHAIDCLGGADRATEVLDRGEYDVILLDNRLPGLSGVEFLATLKERDLDVPVILMTGEPTSDTAIRATNLGAHSYVVKPLEVAELLDELEPLIDEAVEIARSMRERVGLPGEAPADGRTQLLGNSKRMQKVYSLIGKTAATDCNVLILGETGTGKELVARAIHGYSHRRNRPFVPMNCTALSESLLDDELFGHEAGAFTGAERLRKGRFEHASGGTLFLDEVGDMPLALQAKLLRVLENREIVRVGGNEPIQVDVRIVSATHRDLDARVRQGQFREDLLYRLRDMPL
ncbi:MAG: sigma-54 dependent transcriptional regulator, partial [Planctomycetes bacterium]|nr:sigma-54 dependent transcriptional regulator [Planctomycetota bacterium]